MKRIRQFQCGLESLEPRCLLAGDLVISEFMALNTATLQDEDGDYSDWIEIYNNDSVSHSLNNWHLTNETNNLTQWTFPNGITLLPGEFLRVFASNKNRTANVDQLHTNFTLDESGGNVALVSSALSVEHQYLSYPKQVANVSYGLKMPDGVESVTMLAPEIDTWVRESDPDRSYENDAIHVATPDAEGENRWGVFQWDLSELDNLVSAHMEFARRSRGTAGNTQVAFKIDEDIQGITWNQYQDSKLDTEIALDSLGSIDVETDLPTDTYAAGNQASADDIQLLNQLRTTTGKLAVVVKATNGSFEWHDGPNQGGPGFGGVDLPVRLVVQERLERIGLDDVVFFVDASPGDFNAGGVESLSTGIFLTEFLARNQNGVTDEDGDASGWIELFNNDAVSRDLGGWHLTNDASDKEMWTFPASTTMEPGQFLRIFSSGKNRLANIDSLHTNFQLDGNGGFLALVDKGLTIEHQYESYPPQLVDVSYGITMPEKDDGEGIVLPPDVDTWVRESDPNRSYENDAMWIAHPSVFGENRWGVAEWDFSGVTQQIIGAHMEFSPRTRADIGATQEAYTIDHDIVGITWNEYQDTKLDTEEPLDSLGAVTIPDTGVPFNTYVTGEEASADDIGLLNTLRTTTQKFTVTFKAANNSMEWNDGANRAGGGFQSNIPIRLVLEVDSPFIPIELDRDAEFFFVTVTHADYNIGGSHNLVAGLFITEFMANNGGDLRDEDGESSDWIEIYNATPDAIDIGGWHLTDNETLLDKWSFPENSSIASGEFLVVFASDKNRAESGREFHANFKLSSNGEYLGLVDANLNVRHDYTFPQQFQDIAYGIGIEPQVVEEPKDSPAPAGALYRVDFDDASGARLMNGSETLAAEASFRFDHNSGRWNNPTVPHHEGGFGGVDFFSRELVDSNGQNPITWTHLDGDPVRANNPGTPDAVHGDFWFLTVDTFVDWEITGLEPNTEYEMFHYGGWGPSTPDDERITIIIDTDGDGEVDTAHEAGLSTGGPDGTHFASIFTDQDGRILGRWESAPGVPSWADTAGFQLARITDSLSPPALAPGVPIDSSNVGYLTTQTPGDFNIKDVVDGFVDDTTFDTDRGFYESDEAFHVGIHTTTEDAQIFYTLDGTEPDPNSPSSVLWDPGNRPFIDRTTVLRAAAFKDRFQPSNVDTQSYIFLDDVIQQSPTGAAPEGWPSGNVGGQVFDYGMDPDIVNDPVWGPQLRDALESLSTFSIVTDLDNLVDPGTGIYVNAGGQGMAWERPASVELIHPDGSEGFQVNAGIRPRGNFSASGSNPKHAFRLFFRDKYGDAKLNYPLFGDEGVDEFKKIDLRTAQNDSWPFQASTQYTFVHDVFSRDNQRWMGQPYTRSRYHHLYINGVYWGLFQTQERSEANYGASYFGGNDSDYDVIKSTGGPQYQTEFTDGNFNAWRELWTGLRAGVEDDAAYLKLQGLNLDGTRNSDYPVLLDVDNLIDYMIDIFYTGDEDRGLSRPLQHNRPNNFFAVRNRNGDQGFQFFSQDAEQSMLSAHNVAGLNANRLGPFRGTNQNNFAYSNPQWMHQDLLANEQYRWEFQDRVHKYFFNGGIFTADAATQRFLGRAAELETAIVAESARWGDAHPSRRTRPLDKGNWQNAIDRLVDRFLARRTDIVLDQLRNARRESDNGLVTAPLYPETSAPVFNQHGGTVNTGFDISMLDPGSVTIDDTVLFTQGYPVRVHVPVDDSDGTDWTALDFDEFGDWFDGDNGVGYEESFNEVIDYLDFIETDVGFEMFEQQTSVYVRIEFDLNNLNDIDRLILKMKYDDGFVAYLDGVEVARSSNAPTGVPSFDATTNGVHDDAQAIVFEELDISGALTGLTDGRHVLAIHGINVGLDSTDLLILPELVSREISQVPSDGVIYYTIDGSDPRQYDAETGNVSISASARSFDLDPPQAFDSTTLVKARVFDGGEWSALNEALFVVDSPSGLVITEINYNPYAPTVEESQALPNVDNEEFEFLEFANVHPTDRVNLGGFTLSGGVDFTFPVVNLDPGERAVVVENEAAFRQRYGDEVTILGQWSGGLSNNGESLSVNDGSGNTVWNVEYDDGNPWPVSPDGVGTTLQLIDPANTPVDQLGKYYHWRASTQIGGSPGTAGAESIGVVINEVLAHTDPPVTLSDSIELFNRTGTPINIGGWYLSDSDANLLKFRIPDGTTIPAGGYAVFDETDFNPTPLNPGPNKFALSGANGDDVWLVTANASNRVTAIVDDVHFGASPNGESFGRTPNATGRLAPMSTPSFDGPNESPRVGPVVISEINYNPGAPSVEALALDADICANDLEFVEIHNPTSELINLTDWRIRGGIDFEFAADSLLRPLETLIVISFNPGNLINADRLSAFKAHYGIGEDVRIEGGYSRQLNDDGERVQLQRPDEPPIEAPEVIPRLWEDEVLYDDLTPWPAADGTGLSIVRFSAHSFGNDASSWQAREATPGIFGSGQGDFNGDGIVDVEDVDLLSAGIRTGDAAFDLDGDGVARSSDLTVMIKTILGTHFGDANLDGSFDTGDLVQVFQVGEYEDAIAGNSTWGDGDWSGDGDFDTTDLVVAFQDGGYIAAAIIHRQGRTVDGHVAGAIGHDKTDPHHEDSNRVVPSLIADAELPIENVLEQQVIDELFAADRSRGKGIESAEFRPDEFFAWE